MALIDTPPDRSTDRAPLPEAAPEPEKKIVAANTKLLVIAVHPADDVSNGGIILPGGTSGRKLVFGRILSAGPLAKLPGAPLPMMKPVADGVPSVPVPPEGCNLEGQVVIFERGVAAEFRLGSSGTLFLLDSQDVLAFLDGWQVEVGDREAPKVRTVLS